MANGAIRQLKAWAKKRIKTIVWAVGIFTTLCGGIIAADKTWPIVEPKLPVGGEYVRQVAQLEAQAVKNELLPVLQDMLKSQRDSQVETAEGKLDAAVQNKKKWNLELSKTQDPTTRDMIDKDISDLDRTIKKLNDQIDTLNKLRQQGR